jgi:hypothetical protein
MGSSASARPGTPSGSTAAVPPANLNGGNTLGPGASRSDVATGAGTAGNTGTTGNVAGSNTLGHSETPSSIAAGSGSSSSSMTGSGAGSSANSSSSNDASLNTEVRQQLSSGIPAAVVSGGQVYILAVDAKDLAVHAGQTVRVSGRTAANNVIIPEKIEARQGATGDFREVAFTKPNISGSRTAEER